MTSRFLQARGSRIPCTLQQHDRRDRAAQRRCVGFRHPRVALDQRYIARHQREWLGVAVLGLAQACDRCRICGIAGQVKSTQRLDRNDATRQEQRAGRFDCILVRYRWFQPYARAARRAGNRLSVKAAIRRIAILRRTVRTHAEWPHRRGAAIVGNRFNDRQPRSALRAVGERIAESSCRRVQNLLPAVRTNRGIRHHSSMDRARVAIHDPKVGAVGRHGCRLPLDRVDAGERQRRAHQSIDQPDDVVRGTAKQRADPGAVVADPATQPVLMREAPDGWAEADALHQTTHTNQFSTFPFALPRGGGPCLISR